MRERKGEETKDKGRIRGGKGERKARKEARERGGSSEGERLGKG